ncbi:MAG: hypothetical protein ACE5K9_05110 [Candidatus Methylomirabilales bacterium]
MRKISVLGVVGLIVLGLVGMGIAGPIYTWDQVVERGMPDFNNAFVAKQASMETSPLDLSFPSGVDVVFLFVSHHGQMYAVYHDRKTQDVVGIASLDLDPSGPQGFHLYEFYIDTGLLEGRTLTGKFQYFLGNDPIFAGMCRIADLSNEARPHAECPAGA